MTAAEPPTEPSREPPTEAPTRAPGGPPWAGWAPSRAREAAFLGGLAVVQVMGTTGAARNQPDRASLDALAYLLLVAGPALLALRRRYPVATLAGVLAVDTVYFGLGYPYGPAVLSAVVAVVGAVVRGRRLAAWVGGSAALGAYFGLAAVVDGHGPSTASVTGHVAWLLVLLSVSELARAQRTRVDEARRTRAERERRRASEQRLRIAQELHDVLGHNISLINVQASVALHLMDAEPEQARTALQAIKEASKGMLAETRSALDVLRDGDAPRAPAPRLVDLSDLVAQCSAAGLHVSVTTRGASRPVGPTVDLAGYRIVQEALTNVLRHADATAADVVLDFRAEELVVSVTDSGNGHGHGSAARSHPAAPSGPPDGPAEPASGQAGDGERAGEAGRGGQGIAGMRERAATVGGSLTAGPRPTGGFAVVARLPVALGASTAPGQREDG